MWPWQNTLLALLFCWLWSKYMFSITLLSSSLKTSKRIFIISPKCTQNHTHTHTCMHTHTQALCVKTQSCQSGASIEALFAPVVSTAIFHHQHPHHIICHRTAQPSSSKTWIQIRYMLSFNNTVHLTEWRSWFPFLSLPSPKLQNNWPQQQHNLVSPTL